MKNKSLLLCTLVISTSINGMKRTLEIQSAPTTLITLPEDCLWRICIPERDNWKKSSKKLRSITNSIESLAKVSKSFNAIFSPARIPALLGANGTNKNLFLLRAAQAGIPCFVQYAIHNGADVNYSKKNEFQPLTYAVMCKNYRCAELLLDAKAHTTQSTKNFTVYRQPIQLATDAGDLKMVTLLLNFKADPNTTTFEGGPRIFQCTLRTLDIALNKRHIAIAQLLIEKGAIANERDKLKLQELQATVRSIQKTQKK